MPANQIEKSSLFRLLGNEVFSTCGAVAIIFKFARADHGAQTPVLLKDTGRIGC